MEKKQKQSIKNLTPEEFIKTDFEKKQIELKEIIKKVETEFGKGLLMNLSAAPNVASNSLSTGIYSFDKILGIGGFPRGRIIELYGPESSGKTTIALFCAAVVQKNNGIVAFIDAEHALDSDHAKKLGIDIENLIVSQPDYGEQALELVNYLSELRTVDLIIVDSVASLIPKAELDGEILDQSIGLQARMMSKAMRLISAIAAKTNTTIIFINQLREKIGVIFGNPEITPGGRSLKFYSSIRIDVRAKEKISHENVIVGQKIQIKVVKNKMAPPYKKTDVNFYFDRGFDLEEDYINYLLLTEEIIQKGSWFYKDGKVLGQGKKEAFKVLKS